MPTRPSRRTVVAAALAVPAAAASGCTLSDSSPPREPQQRSAEEVDPDVALLDEVSFATDEMVALYEASVERHRVLRRDLRPLLQAHREHADALGDAAPEPRRDQGRGQRRDRGRHGSGDPASEPTPGDVTVPARRPEALRDLAAAERAHAVALMDATGRAASGDFARLLASMSAASATAERVLAEVGGR